MFKKALQMNHENDSNGFAVSGKKVCEEEWPVQGLEPVTTCPVCGCDQRALLHEDLADYVFFTAPGRWSLYRCTKCRTAYLDPRPRLEFIHLAYGTYYTHIAPQSRMPLEALPLYRRIRRSLANGYSNWRYGTQETPSSRLGIVAAWLLPGLRRRLDVRFRFLPRPPQGGRVLDVGFGSGAFLHDAQTAGWRVAGVDPDAKAVENAKARGLDVREGRIEAFSSEPESFDAITLNHVIEHVHDPLAVLRMAFALLKPGGMLYVDTPNIESLGHRVFGRSWRDLDPPRHLVIFCHDSLQHTLKKAGFDTIRFLKRTDLCEGIFATSYRIAHLQDPYGHHRDLSNWKARWANIQCHIQPEKSEFLTVVATKGGEMR